ncbi:MAG: hypothetical protein ABIO24_05835, partial [Saprospiraceae bacterium]
CCSPNVTCPSEVACQRNFFFIIVWLNQATSPTVFVENGQCRFKKLGFPPFLRLKSEICA